MVLKYSFVIFLLISCSMSAQLNKLISSQGDMNSKNISPLKDNFTGGVYLYNNWNKTAVFKSITDSFIVKGVNFNIKSGNFEIKISSDSIFIVNPVSFKSISVGNELFKYDVLNNRKFLQVIYESKNLSLYKHYVLVIKKGNYNPLNGKFTPNELTPKSKYLLLQNGSINNNFILNKKNTLKLFFNFKTKVDKYAKANKLKYKKEKDIIKILTFYNSLQIQ